MAATPSAFLSYGGKTFEEHGPDGWQRRTRLPVDRLLSIEQMFERFTAAESPIRVLFSRWRERSGGVPARLSFLDVSNEDPLGFVFHNHAGRAYGSLSGICFREYPIGSHARCCALEYHDCKTSGAPAAHHIEQRMDGVDREYFRLMAPLTNERGQVTNILYAFRHLRPVVPASRSG